MIGKFRASAAVVFQLGRLPVFWGLLYLALIPVFATLFWVNSASFRLAYATDEAAYKDELHKITLFIRQNLTEHVDRFCANTPCETHLVIDRIARIENDRIILDLILGETTFDPVTRSEDILGSVEYRVMQNSFLPGGMDFPVLNFAREDNTTLPRLHKDLNIITLPVTQEAFLAFLIVTDGSDGIYSDFLEEYREVYKAPSVWARVFDGGKSIEPWPIEYRRYLYFSAVTITTLGYGDIVPIDSRARFFVALEAIVGLIIMGFFLNAVTRRDL